MSRQLWREWLPWSSATGISVIIFASNSGIARRLRPALQQFGYDVEIGALSGKVHDHSGPAVAIIVKSEKDTSAEPLYLRIRSHAPELPIIILGPDDLKAKLRLFELGLDDYVVYPADELELATRIKALVRRRALT